MRVAVTGATGFVGRHTVELLLRRGHSVRFLARGPSPTAALLEQRGATPVSGHLADASAVRRLVRDTDSLVHLVGIIVERGAATFPAVHVDGTRQVLDAARAAGVRHLVHMSALGARAEPSATLYHRTKWEAESLVVASGLMAAVLRPSLINGPENVPVRTLERLHRVLPVVPVFGRADFPLQPVWIEDVALVVALAVEQEAVGTFELGGPEVITFADFVRLIGRAAGHPRPLVHIPLAIVRTAARLLDPLGPWAPITSSQLQMLIEGTATPANAITRVFGVTPLSFGEGLARVFQKDQTRG